MQYSSAQVAGTMRAPRPKQSINCRPGYFPADFNVTSASQRDVKLQRKRSRRLLGLLNSGKYEAFSRLLEVVFLNMTVDCRCQLSSQNLISIKGP